MEGLHNRGDWKYAAGETYSLSREKPVQGPDLDSVNGLEKMFIRRKSIEGSERLRRCISTLHPVDSLELLQMLQGSQFRRHTAPTELTLDLQGPTRDHGGRNSFDQKVL
jgi:hypothetical protein